MCTYNGEKFIEKQIESVLNQTYGDFKLYVFDDNSIDNTVNIIKSFNDQRIEIYRNPQTLGIIKNFEQAISMCEGDYIALCDQDDIWETDKLETQIEYMRNDKPFFVFSDLNVIDENDNLITQSYFQMKGYDKFDFATIISRSGIMGNTLMFNRALKNKILPFFYKIPMYDYFIGVMGTIFGDYHIIKKPLVKYRFHKKNFGNKKKSFINKTDICQFPHKEKIDFLRWVYHFANNEQKKEINELLKVINSDKWSDLFLGMKKGYFKGNEWYLTKLILRFLFCKKIKK